MTQNKNELKKKAQLMRHRPTVLKDATGRNPRMVALWYIMLSFGAVSLGGLWAVSVDETPFGAIVHILTGSLFKLDSLSFFANGAAALCTIVGAFLFGVGLNKLFNAPTPSAQVDSTARQD